MSRRKIVKRIKESNCYTNADLSFLDIITIDNLIKRQKNVYERITNVIKDILVGTIQPSFSKKTSCYYGIKSFLKFKDKEGVLPCFVTRDCMMPSLIGIDMIILEWNFIWIGKRNGLNIAYLEILQIMTLKDIAVQPIERVLDCLNVKESFRLASVATKKTSPIATNLVGKVCGVSEIFWTSDGKENFIVWLEDLNDQNDFAFVSVNLPNFFWIQSWLQHKDTYIFVDVSLEFLNLDGRPVTYFMASDNFRVELYNSVRVSMEFISSEDVLRVNNIDKSEIDQQINSCNFHINHLKGLSMISGIVTEARYSRFGKFILNEHIQVYLHMCGGGNFEHVRPGSEVKLENVYLLDNLIVGGPLSRMVITSLEFQESSCDEPIFDDSQEAESISIANDHLSDQDYKPSRILAELLENCDFMSYKQLDDLIRFVALPQKLFCHNLLSSISFKTYRDMFTSSVSKPAGANAFCNENTKYVNARLPVTPMQCFETMQKIENCMFGKYDGAPAESSVTVDCLFSGNKSSEIITIQELHDKDVKDKHFKLFERIQDYWECNILTSNLSDVNLRLFGMLKMDDQRACLSLVDSNNFIECVVTDVNDSPTLHSCFQSNSCKLSCKLSETISQSASCPRVHVAHVHCLVRIDKFFLVSEKFKLCLDESMDDEVDDVLEKRYLVFSASDIVLFGPHMLLEMGVTYFPCWPILKDIKRFESNQFSSSEWTHFSFEAAKYETHRFNYECFILKNLFQECDDHSFEGIHEQKQDLKLCTCKLSFIFVVKTKDGPIMRLKNPRNDFDAFELLEIYLKDIDPCISKEGRPEMSSINSQPGEEGHIQNWKLTEKLVAVQNVTNVRDIKFFESKNCYQFGMTVFIVGFNNVICDHCLSTTRISKQDPRFQEVFGILEFDDYSEEVFMAFSDKCSGWYPTFHPGCVYEIDLRGDHCTPVRKQFKTSANKLPGFIKKRKVETFGWNYVIEISECQKMNIKRCYKDWFGLTFQNLPHEADDNICVVSNVKSAFRNARNHLTFHQDGRINLGEGFETLLGIVIMKRFNLSKNSSENVQQNCRKEFKIDFSMGNSLPGSRDVVVTIQLLGNEETVKVFISNNSLFKYVLGVLSGSCVCFSRVLKINSNAKYKNSKVYTFLSMSNLEVLRFPSNPFACVDKNSLSRFTFNNREIHAETQASQEERSNKESAQNQSMFINSASLFEYSEVQASPDQSWLVEDKPRPGNSLRGLLYQNDSNISANVLVKNISKIELHYSCARHPDVRQCNVSDHSCCLCNSSLTMFRAILKVSFCDSTAKSHAICRDEFARRVLNLSEQSWKELGELVAFCPKKTVCYDRDKKKVYGGDLVADVECFLDVLANSQQVHRRLFIKANRFRTLLNHDGLKSFDLRFGPQPEDTGAAPIASNLGLQERINACRHFVRSTRSNSRNLSLPIINLELTHIAEAGN